MLTLIFNRADAGPVVPYIPDEIWIAQARSTIWAADNRNLIWIAGNRSKIWTGTD